MAATTGIVALSTVNVQADLLKHLIPASTAVATAITITGPMKLALFTSAWSNTAAGTECTDANYVRQSITSWSAPATTTGAGYQVGYTQSTNGNTLTFGGATGFAVAQSLTGLALYSSDTTPVAVFYQNFASTVSVPINNQYTFAIGAFSVSMN